LRINDFMTGGDFDLDKSPAAAAGRPATGAKSTLGIHRKGIEGGRLGPLGEVRFGRWRHGRKH
jgi:hypothetical protein